MYVNTVTFCSVNFFFQTFCVLLLLFKSDPCWFKIIQKVLALNVKSVDFSPEPMMAGRSVNLNR